MRTAIFGLDNELAKDRYRQLSDQYDYATRRIEPVRKLAIDTLDLQPGDRVLDIACGTGKSLEMLRNAVGTEGLVVGIEQSPEMMEHARERVREGNWDNVQLIESAVETADIQGTFDAVLFVYTQDVLQSEAAVAHIFKSTRPGARVASTGLKLFPWYIGIANLWLIAISYPYFTTFKGLAKPWAPLERYVDIKNVQQTFFGSGYIAHGIRR